jgi:NitT/TauT family transport system permease protein
MQLLVPAPHEVFHEAFIDADSRRQLIEGFFITARVAAVGLIFSILIGTTVAMLMSQARWVEDALFPYAVMLQVLPVLAIVPLLGLLVGFDFKSRVIVSTIISLFPIITNTLFGMKSADSGLHALFTLQRASRRTRMRKLQIPAALPAIFTGWRIAAGLSVVGAIVGDFFFRQGDPGLGILLDRYRAQLQTERLYAAIIYSGILGILVFLFFGWLNRKTVGKWYEERD